jgi:hypothetical protein
LSEKKRMERNEQVCIGRNALFMLLISGCGIRMDTEETIKETDPPSESNVGDEMENNMDESIVSVKSCACRKSNAAFQRRLEWQLSGSSFDQGSNLSSSATGAASMVPYFLRSSGSTVRR